MDVLILLIVVSVALAAGFVTLFARSLRDRTFDHSERLALLPLDEDEK